MPYGRELSVPLGVINDTFETAVTWDKFEDFHTAVSKATAEAIREATGKAGTVSTRFTHVYPDGPAPYYTFNGRGTPGKLVDGAAVAPNPPRRFVGSPEAALLSVGSLAL